MASKYICRCLKKVDKLTSYYPDGIRVTVCDECAERLKLNNASIEKEDYEDAKKNKKVQYDTRIK